MKRSKFLKLTTLAAFASGLLAGAIARRKQEIDWIKANAKFQQPKEDSRYHVVLIKDTLEARAIMENTTYREWARFKYAEEHRMIWGKKIEKQIVFAIDTELLKEHNGTIRI